MKAYWISLYLKVDNQENLKKYAETVTPIIKSYGPTKDYIKEVKTACLWKKKSSTFEPDFCPIRLNSDPWIVQPTEHYEELSIEEILKQNK